MWNFDKKQLTKSARFAAIVSARVFTQAARISGAESAFKWRAAAAVCAVLSVYLADDGDNFMCVTCSDALACTAHCWQYVNNFAQRPKSTRPLFECTQCFLRIIMYSALVSMYMPAYKYKWSRRVQVESRETCTLYLCFILQNILYKTSFSGFTVCVLRS